MSDSKPFVVVAAGFGNYTREYPAYVKKFGKENVVWTSNYKRYTVEDHLEELESKIPKDKPYILVGHSLGGSIIIELMSRKALKNCQGVSLNGASRKILSHWFLNFLFYLPVPIIFSFFVLMVILFPLNFVLTGFNLHKAKQASFEGITRLIENGTREIKKEYNFCLRKIGREVSSIHKDSINIPTLFIHLEKEMMVDEEDLEMTKSLYKNKRVKIIKSDTMHLTHDFDYVVADLIGEELDFFGYEKISKSS